MLRLLRGRARATKVRALTDESTATDHYDFHGCHLCFPCTYLRVFCQANKDDSEQIPFLKVLVSPLTRQAPSLVGNVVARSEIQGLHVLSANRTRARGHRRSRGRLSTFAARGEALLVRGGPGPGDQGWSRRTPSPTIRRGGRDRWGLGEGAGGAGTARGGACAAARR